MALLRVIRARHVADSRAMERLVGASDADWTIVRPPRLLEGGAPRAYRVTVGDRAEGIWAMQRADLAAFLLDEAENKEHPQAIAGVTSASAVNVSTSSLQQSSSPIRHIGASRSVMSVTSKTQPN